MPRPTRTLTLASDAITVEGSLIPPAMLARVAAQEADEQTDAAYRIPKGLTLRDEMARYFRIGQALFADLNTATAPSLAKAITFAELLLRDVFGFADVARVGTRSLHDRVFAVTLEGLGGRVPCVVVPPADDLDRPSTHLTGDHRRRSAASALQDWLNAKEDAVWGLCCNGERLRLLRDNASLTRPAYIEADLRRIFEGEAFADFTALWLLLHASRFGTAGAGPFDSPLERWREAGQREGVTAREKLRDGVEAALLALGNGFLGDEQNGALRERVATSSLPLPEFFGELLRLVYRLIFLLTAEDRDLLHAPGASAEARRLYAEGYSLGLLRDRAVRRAAWDRHHDRWEGLLISFAALARGEPRLGLPALNGGLFAPDLIPDLESARLPNRALMEAIYRLAWLRELAGLVRVNWRDMETEELGSVYESLLELTPRLVDEGRGMAFAEGGEAKGHARKTSGSYYTPDSLVQALLDSALDPVLDRIEAEADDPAKALLGVTVVDPACGSGHFLLAAARRIATRLARARADGGVPSAADFRHALRDVVRACIHGVDRNPMAVELTKVALWIETVDPGKPLGFLDANIRCGDALLGVFALGVLAEGIPDAAYKPLTGDDKATAKYYAAKNRDDRKGQGRLDFGKGGSKLPAAPLARAMQTLRVMSEDSPSDIVEKRRRFEAARAERSSYALGEAADLYIAAFLMPKTGGPPQLGQAPVVPTTGDVWRALADRQVHPPLVARAVEVSRQARAFHWPLEFPDVMAAGGFDLVLGNPPWEQIQLNPQEWFASLAPEIAEAENMAARDSMISSLETTNPDLFRSYQIALRQIETYQGFIHHSGRYPTSSFGRLNTAACFLELVSDLAAKGAAGIIVPSGSLTDSFNQYLFQKIFEGRRLSKAFDFENRDGIFPAVHRSYKFSLLTLGRDVGETEFAFFLTDASQLIAPERRFALTPDEIARINPNTKTAPVFRSRADAELTAKIYDRVPVLIDEAKGPEGNPWQLSFQLMFMMNTSSGLFRTTAQLRAKGFERAGTDWVRDTERYVPLYEGKMFDFYDHRAASYSSRGDARGFRVLPPVSIEQHEDPYFEIEPYYWIRQVDLDAVLDRKISEYIAFSKVTGTSNERTFKCYLVPRGGLGDSAIAIYLGHGAEFKAVLVSAMSSLVFDYTARVKVGGVNINFFHVKQLPAPAPSSITSDDLNFIVPRVLELTYTSHSMAPFARDLGYAGPPFAWNEERRAQLRAELDAWYARAYGLTRDELRYILDPSDVKGADYPSETFRVLKTNEIRRYGEYRTARLVLAAWDAQEAASKARAAD